MQVTASEAADKIRKSATRVWSQEHLNREIERVMAAKPGSHVYFEDRYMGEPQGAVICSDDDPSWREKSQTSSRVIFIGQIA